MLQAEDHAAAVQIQHRTTRLTRKRVVPVEVQRGAVRGRQRVPVDPDPGDRFPRGCDIVEHPVAVDPPGLDVADGGGSACPMASNNGPSSASTCASIPSAMVPTVTWTHVTRAQTGLIARELGHDRRAQGFTAATQAMGVWTTLSGTG